MAERNVAPKRALIQRFELRFIAGHSDLPKEIAEPPREKLRLGDLPALEELPVAFVYRGVHSDHLVGAFWKPEMLEALLYCRVF